jgi:hypothetical protein
LYGVTAGGGANSGGSLYQIAFTGTYSQLFSFTKPGSRTQEPNAILAQHTNGTFYGVTVAGGANALGSIYTLHMGLSPFVAFVQSQGSVGSTAQILGQGLTGATSITFNGVPATSFSVVNDTFMTAVVPSGATTGPVLVTTPAGPLTSNKNFHIQ